MSDPFVQRMLARSQARRDALNKLSGESNKENTKNAMRSSPQKLKDEEPLPILSSKTARYSPDKPKQRINSNISDLTNVLQDNSENMTKNTSTPLPKPLSAVSQSSVPTHSQTRCQRFQNLAKRAQEMDNWEDDYTYHSVTGVTQKQVDSGGSGLHVPIASAHSSNALHESKKPLKQKNEADSQSSKEIVTSNGKTYYFGEFGTPSYNKHILDTHYYTPQSSSESFHSAHSNSSPNSPILSIRKNPSYHSMRTSSSSKVKPTADHLTPTRRLAWDKQLLDSLEAQGFTPSASKSRLMYDFKERSPSPVKNCAITKEPKNSPVKYSASSSPKKSPMKSNYSSRFLDKDLQLQKVPVSDSMPFNGLSETKNQIEPPKILHFKSKNMDAHSSNGGRAEVIRGRSQSPTKVSEMKNIWEHHIREASPERIKSTTSSPSSSHQKVNAGHKLPSANSANSLGQNVNKNFQEAKQGVSNNCSVSPKKYVEAQRYSPSKKEISQPNIIKGAVAMPDVATLVDNPNASVKQKAAAFSSIIGPNSAKKDPAEMSLKERKNLFETNKGNALVPKAPFGQCVSGKQLQDKPVASRSYEVPSQPKPSSVCNKTFVCAKDGFGISNERLSAVELQKHRFENVEDNWKRTDINSKIEESKKQDMQILFNRFKKPSNTFIPSEPMEESDSEYPESEASEDYDTASSHSEMVMGPPKPPRTPQVYLHNSSSPTTHSYSPPTHAPHSPSRRLNSTEVGESSPQSPRKCYMPKVKPGCMFPSLSDIDSHSEAYQDSDEDARIKDSSFAESVLTYASGESFGTEIKRLAEWNGASSSGSSDTRSALSVIPETTSERKVDNQGMSASTLDAIGAIDDALDQAFDETTADISTTPKRILECDETKDEGGYKNPKLGDSSCSSSSSSEPLAHSISMYRRQKPAEVVVTPVRPITTIPEFSSPQNSPISPSVSIGARIRRLQAEEEHQLTVISQASGAINVVTQHPQQHGTTQHIEAEKLLLVATQKRLSILHEIQRLKAEGAFGKKSLNGSPGDSCRGSISISNITLPLKQDFINKMHESGPYYVVVLVKHRDQVITSELQASPEGVAEGALTFPNLIALHDLSADFNIALEVYGIKVELQNSAPKKEHSRLRLTPLKRLQKEHKHSSSPSGISSPGGPFAVRTSSFQLIGFANLNIHTLTRNAWTLEKVPFSSPMNGHLLMRVAVRMEESAFQRSFLTLFDDVGGFGAWNRRWCLLSGPFIRYWSYPDDEQRKECLNVLDLRLCTTRKVELVSRDVCARQHTFQLTLMRPAQPGDKTDLVHEVKNNVLISRILLSSDSKEERIIWCQKLNEALANIRAWDPDALKPDDFHV